MAPQSIKKFIFGATQTTGPGRISSTPDEIQEALLRELEGSKSLFGPISDANAMSVAAVWACVRLLSTAVAMLPVALYRKDGEKNVLDVKNPVHRLIAVRPNHWQSPFEFWQMAVGRMLTKGNFYAQKVVYRGEVTDLLPLSSDRVEPVQSITNGISYVYTRDDGSKISFPQKEILHIRSLCLDGLKGLGTLEYARNSIGANIHMEMHGAGMMQNAATPSGALETDLELTDEAFERLRKGIDEHHAGAKNAGRPLILESGLKWKAMSMNAEDLAFIDQRKLTRSEIAMFFGVPPHMIGDIERGTSWGSGIEQQNLGFLVHTLMPYLVNIQQACLRDLLPLTDQPNFIVKFDTSILTRADFVSRQNGLDKMKRSGVLSANEWRKIEGYDPIPGEDGDAYSVSSAGADAQPSEGKSSAPARQGAG